MPSIYNIRAAKQRAIENIKKQLAEEDNYDEYGFPLATTPVHTTHDAYTGPLRTPLKVTLKDVEDAYYNSTYSLPIYALYPPEFREDLLDDDIRLSYCVDVLDDIINDTPLVNTFNKMYQSIMNYYRYHTKEAAEYVLDMMTNYDCDYELEDYYD